MRRFGSEFGWSIVFLGVFLIVILLGISQYQEYRDQRRLWKQVSGFKSQKELWKNYQAMKEENEIKAKYLNGLENKLTVQEDQSEIVTMLRYLAETSNTEILHFSVGSLSQDRYYPVQNLRLTIQGNYQGIVSFLTEVANKFPHKKMFFTMDQYHDLLKCAVDLDFYVQSKRKGDSVEDIF